MVPTDSSEVLHDFSPRFRVYKGGRVERFREIASIPAFPSGDPKTGIRSKDTVVAMDTGVSVRLFVPPIKNLNKKLPLLIYIHGGAFCLQSAFSSVFHKYVSSLASEANVIAVSVEYRLAPEHPIPTCYDDTWDVIRWVFSHAGSQGPETWLNLYAAFDRVFIAGDSAGANIAHQMVIRSTLDHDDLINVLALVLVHPFFGDDEPDKLWMFLCPDNSGTNDTRLNPAADPAQLLSLGCKKMLICLAENDHLKDRGVTYHEALKKSGWEGVVEVFETEGEGHVFHLFNQDSERAVALLKRVAKFIKLTCA
ncbi:hypothetical protein Drorol1_Dr00022915 [Drosera rotundifolia]